MKENFKNIDGQVNSAQKKKMKLITKITIILLAIILIIIGIAAILYYKYNKDIYEKLKVAANGDIVNIDTYKGYAIFSDSNIEYIKNNNISISVEDTNKIAKVILKHGNIDKIIRYDIYAEFLEKGVENISTNKALKIKLTSEKNNLNNIEKIVINDTYNMNNILSLFTKNEDNYIEQEERIIKNNNEITLNILLGQDNTVCDEYIITYIPVQEIKIDKTNITLKKTYSDNVKINILPSNATNRNIEINSSNDKIAILSSDGKLTANGAGKANILINVKNESITNKIAINVQEIANKIMLSKSSITLYPKGSSTVKATVKPKEAINNKVKWTTSNAKVATIKDGKITAVDLGKATITVQTIEEPIIKTKLTVNVVKKPVVVPAPAVSSTEGLTYIKGILLVNKKYSIPSNYNPGVNSTAAVALSKLKAAAKKAGYTISTRSGFRSYNTQKTLYARYVSQYGVASANTFSAQAGHSEHQTGLAFDVGKIDYNYGNTPAGKWLATNAHNYGFIIRYPKGKQAITGYRYEPWHIRYVGTEHAIAIYNSGLCLEEYLGV